MPVTADDLIRIALDAGAVIMDIYAQPFSIGRKADDSPVTDADRAAEDLILAGLLAREPGLPVIAEESAASGDLPGHGGRFALVDPLDGTKEFAARNGEFTVNIAIIAHGRPVMGVVYAPALGRLFVAESCISAWQSDAAPGGAMPAVRTPLKIRKAPAEGLTAVASKSHRTPATDGVLARYPVHKIVGAGSAIKFCLVAAGEADLYPRMGRTMEWDTAAGQAVVEAAGGRVLDLSGAPLVYGKRARGYDNPDFVVYGDVTPILA